jgi:hypothetical protein
MTQHVTSTPSATQRRSMIPPTTTPGTSSGNTPAPSGIPQTNSKHYIVSSPASGHASIPIPLSCLGNLPIPIPNPEAHAIITNPLRTRATARNQRQRQWQLQPQAVSIPRAVVSGSRTIHRFGPCDMTCFVFSTGRLLEIDLWNRRQFMIVGDLETVCCATRCVAKALAEAPYW